jgi:dipeptidyl aminopeptidase/acylaminoacyl peptidase
MKFWRSSVLAVWAKSIARATPGSAAKPPSKAGGWRRMALAVSRSGSAVYVAGDPGKRTLVWVDRTGRVETAAEVPGKISQAVLSPNGHKVLVQIASDLSIYELDTGARRRLTFYGNTGMNASSPMWSRDGSRVIYAANEGVDYDMFSLLADGSRPTQRLLKRPFNQYPTSFTPDGTLLFGEATRTVARICTRYPLMVKSRQYGWRRHSPK